MLKRSLLVLTAAAAALQAGSLGSFTRVDRATAAAQAASTNSPSAAAVEHSNVTLYVWADKYVYQPGEALTLKMTVKTNDPYPYTIVAFRQNNQTGKKTFFGPNQTSETPIDVYGRTSDQGYQPVRVADQTRSVVVGDGGWLNNTALTVPSELGMHTLTVQLRDYTGGRVLKSAYFKIGVVDGFVDVGGVIGQDTTWVNTKAYRIQSLTRVENATLTIQPGTFVIGMPRTDDPTALIITTSAKINAQGTRSRPIIMTSSQPFGNRGREDWGGLVMLGKAKINVTGGTNFIEGLDNRPYLQYGGTDDTHDCGALAYVRVEYAGSVFTTNNEINSFTWGGCGSKTVAHHLQAHYGKDDTFEWFGGNSDLKYAVGSYGADDYLDWQLGWRGRVQYLVGIQHPGTGLGNRGIEADNSEFGATDQPYSDPQVWNTTFVGPGVAAQDETTGDGSPGMYLRRGTRGSVNNAIITNFGYPAVMIRDAQTQAELAAGRLSLNGILMWNNNRLNLSLPNTVEAQVTQSSPAGTDALAYANDPLHNFVAADPQLRRALEYSDPDLRPAIGSPALSLRWNAPPDDGFFDQWANFCGAFDGDNDWSEEWTSFLRDEDIAPKQ
ncbi:hypothetical protein [Paludibaculum fermentans]|uniref:Uncharacterized protein n=1 Tax=Paludibaculum fermentans TaxID=1473598 RepID=A0A7S7SL87_PALFE|nr:hypothetical protein [Paludibaculum fermentans]QOY88553.1 hypothetical protein IRI77_00905 [Paludibaculum fermentans]